MLDKKIKNNTSNVRIDKREKDPKKNPYGKDKLYVNNTRVDNNGMWDPANRNQPIMVMGNSMSTEGYNMPLYVQPNGGPGFVVPPNVGNLNFGPGVSHFVETPMAYGGDPSLPDLTGHYQFGGKYSKTDTHYEHGGEHNNWLDKYQDKGEVKSFISYKDNPNYFDSHAVYSDNPQYNELIRKSVYAGTHEFNPQTGVLRKLNKPVSVPQDVKRMSSADYSGDMRNPKNWTEDARRAYVQKNMEDAYMSELMYAPGMIGLAGLPIGLNSAYGLSSSLGNLEEGNYKTAALEAGLSSLPFASKVPFLNKLSRYKFTPSTSSSINNVGRNLADLQEAQKFAQQYGYELPANLERISQSDMLTDRTVRGMMNRHNTFVRGVSTNWDEIEKRNPEILRHLEGKGIDWKNNPKAAAEYMATHIPISTGYGRSSLNKEVYEKGLEGLYTSNSIPTAEGYTYGKGYITKVKKPTDFSSVNRQDWITKNNPKYVDEDQFRHVNFFERQETPSIIQDVFRKDNPLFANKTHEEKIAAVKKRLSKALKEYPEDKETLADLAKIDKNINQIGTSKYQHNLLRTERSDFPTDPYDFLIAKEGNAKKLSEYLKKQPYQEKMREVNDLGMSLTKYSWDEQQPIRARIKELENEATSMYKQSVQDYMKANHPDYDPVNKYAHYIHLGTPGEQVLQPIKSWEITPEIWKNKSRAHTNKYSKKLSAMYEGGPTNWLDKYQDRGEVKDTYHSLYGTPQLNLTQEEKRRALNPTPEEQKQDYLRHLYTKGSGRVEESISPIDILGPAELKAAASLVKSGVKSLPKVLKTLPNSPNSTLQKAGFNPLAIADNLIPIPLNPQRAIGMSGSWMDLSPLNALPFYGKKLAAESNYPRIVGFRKFGNSIQDVIDRQALSPKGRTNPFGGKSAFVDEGNWAAVGAPDETYKGVFEATMNPQIEGSNIQLSRLGKREGVSGTTKQGDVDISLTDPGLSFNRRLPFSTRYVPIDKQKLINNEFQLATAAPHLQSLIEKYGVGLGIAAALKYMGNPDAIKSYNDMTINPIMNMSKQAYDSLVRRTGIDPMMYLSNPSQNKEIGGELDKYQYAGSTPKLNVSPEEIQRVINSNKTPQYGTPEYVKTYGTGRADISPIDPLDFIPGMAVGDVALKGLMSAGKAGVKAAPKVVKNISNVASKYFPEDIENAKKTAAIFNNLKFDIKNFPDIKDIQQSYKTNLDELISPEGLRRLKELGVEDPNDFIKFAKNVKKTVKDINTEYVPLNMGAVNVNPEQIKLFKNDAIPFISHKAAIDHEYGHLIQDYLQRKGKTYKGLSDLDIEAVSGLYPHVTKDVSDLFNKVVLLQPEEAKLIAQESGQRLPYYFFKGSEQSEPLAHLRETKRIMKDQGIIKDIHENITPEMINNFRQLTGNKDRIASFLQNTPEANKALSDLLNKTPAMIPIGLGAAGSLKEEKQGGQLKLKRRKGTGQNIQSSVNDLFMQNELLFGPPGKRRFVPYKEDGGESNNTGGWLDNYL